MNKQENIYLLNQALNVQNDKLQLQVEVLTQQVSLLQKQWNEHQVVYQTIHKLEIENMSLKRDLLRLQEKIIEVEDKKDKSMDDFYANKLKSQEKEHQKELLDLKKEFQDKIYNLTNEKTQLYEQAVALGIQNQTSKNLEQQAQKVLTISSKLEKLLYDLPQSSPTQNSYKGTAKEIYDDLINKLNTKQRDSGDNLFNSSRGTKRTQLDYLKNGQTLSAKKLLTLTHPNGSPKNGNYINHITSNQINSKKN